MSAHYDDPAYSYTQYWVNRDYEHAAENIAIKTLLENIHVSSAVDIGGGYGRLTGILSRYANHAILLEPSAKLRSQAKKYLSNYPKVSIISGTAEHTSLDPQSQNLVMMVRVFHHIPDLNPVFSELSRIIKPSGYLLFEFANSLNFKSRIRSLLTGSPILLTPLERRSQANIRKGTISFVNHHPSTVFKIMSQHGFSVYQTLSVSNFRSPLVKQILPFRLLLILEKICQPLLAKLYFGPSIFVLARYNP